MRSTSVWQPMQNSRMQGGSLSPKSMAPGKPVASIRALVVGVDAGYRRRAQIVVAELGSVAFAPIMPTDAVDVAFLARRESADVVVLDASGCEAAVAAVIAALADVMPRIGVVVVCEHMTPAAQRLLALPKWGWRSELRGAIQRAAIDGSPLALRPTLKADMRRDLRGLEPGRLSRR
jgi:hypothetical protein